MEGFLFKTKRNKRSLPPVRADRVGELGKWKKKAIKASGTSWDVNSMDIAVAGLGWFSLGLKGDANLSLWTCDSIGIALREPLVLDRAAFLERPGFWLPKAISDATENQSEVEAQLRKKHQEEDTLSLSEMSCCAYCYFGLRHLRLRRRWKNVWEWKRLRFRHSPVLYKPDSVDAAALANCKHSQKSTMSSHNLSMNNEVNFTLCTRR